MDSSPPFAVVQGRYSKVRMHSYLAARVACCSVAVLADENVLSNSSKAIAGQVAQTHSLYL